MNVDGRCVATPPGFPSDVFTLDVSPSAIRWSLEPYRGFATTARDVTEGFAGATVRWAGPEGAVYSERRVAYSGMAAAAQGTFTRFHRGVSDFADTAERLHGRMAHVRAQAESLWISLHTSPTPTPAATDPFALSSGPMSLAARQGAEAEYARLYDEARRIRAELGDAARAAAAVVRGLPSPPPTPSTAAAHTAMPPVVTNRRTYSAESTEVVLSALSRQGIHVEVDSLDDGRVVVRVMNEGTLGGAVGFGGGASVSTSEGGPGSKGARRPGGATGIEHGGDAEATAAAGAGVVYEMDRAQLTPFLLRLAALDGEPVAAPTGAGTRTGMLIQGSLTGAARYEASVPGIAGAEAEATMQGRVRGEFYDDGSTVVTLTAAAGAKGEASADMLDPQTVDWLEKLDVDGLGDLPEEAGLGPVALGAAGAVAWTLSKKPDGSATVTKSVRVEIEGEDQVRERRTTRVVDRREADELEDDIQHGRLDEAAEQLREMADDLEAGSGASTESHEYVYEVVEKEGSAEIGGSAGVKGSLEAGYSYREENLVEVDGVRRA